MSSRPIAPARRLIAGLLAASLLLPAAALGDQPSGAERAGERSGAERSARRQRIAGIALTAGGLGQAAGLGLLALFVHSLQQGGFGCVPLSVGGRCTPPENDHFVRNLGIASLSFVGLALAVGIPLWMSGDLQLSAIRRRKRPSLFELDVSLGQRHGAVLASWRF